MTDLRKSQKEFEVEFTPLFEMFYSDESNYGVFEVDVISDDADSNIVKSMMGKQSIVVVGNTTRLERNRKYIAKLTVTSHKKYGKQFKIMTIYEKTPQSKEEQKLYLSTLLTPKQVDALYEVYGEEEDMLELIIENKIDHTKVHGLGEVTYEKVKKKVEENMLYAKALVELTTKFALTVTVIKKLVDHYGSANVLLSRIYENPYELAEKVNGIGFIKADEIAQNAGISKESPNRILACAKHVLKQSGSTGGHCFLVKKQLITSMYELLRLKKDKIIEIFDKHVDEDYDLIADDKRIGLASIYTAEKGIVDCLYDLLSYSESMEVENFEAKIAQVELEQGFSYTEEQRLAIETACRSNVVFISGKAGTGKTSVMKGILKILLSGSDHLLYDTCAFSGKASQRIKESTGYKSKTIHRLLGYGKNDDGNGMFKFHADNPLEADIIVLDEASMVNSKILFNLVSAIKSGARFICLGDHAQLEPIGEGFAFGDLLKSKKFPTVELTIVQRQALKSGVLSIANKIREGKNFMVGLEENKPQKLGELKDLLFCPYHDKAKLEKTLLRLCKEYKGEILDFQVIVPTRKRGDLCSNNLNIQLQEIFNPICEDRRKLNYNGIEYREKDKIITKGNDYDKSVFNGTLGIIDFIDEVAKIAKIQFEDGAIHEYELKDFDKIELGYALTIHRCQGSQFKYCVVAVENSAWTMLSQQLLYTALTRTIKNCILFGQVEALEQCIRSNKSVNRQTYLPYFLKELPKFQMAREA